MSTLLLLLASYAFFFILFPVIILQQDDRKRQLITVGIFSIIFLGLPSVFFPLPIEFDFMELFALSVYPVILILLKLKYNELFNKAEAILIGLTAVVLAFYIYGTYVVALHADPTWFMFPLMFANPEFIVIFAEDNLSAARTIIAYEADLNLIFFGSSLLGLMLSALHVLAPTNIWYPVLITVIVFSLLISVTLIILKKRPRNESRLLALHILLSVFLGGLVALIIGFGTF